jgi:hypothetical protein
LHNLLDMIVVETKFINLVGDSCGLEEGNSHTLCGI